MLMNCRSNFHVIHQTLSIVCVDVIQIAFKLAHKHEETLISDLNGKLYELQFFSGKPL